MTKLLTLLGVVGMAIAATAQTAQFPNINVRTNATTGSAVITNSAAGTTPLTINSPTGQTAPAIARNVNGVSFFQLYGEAANTLALRNGANAQAFNVYNTHTDASNYERITVGWNANAALIRANKLGSGTLRNIYLGGSEVEFQSGSGLSSRWKIDTSGNFITLADNTYDIGASGATRPRNVYVGTGVIAGGGITAGNTGGFSTGRMSLDTTEADGVVRLSNVGETDFNRLQFGGTTASFPSLKRSTTNLVARLADDSADTDFQASHFIVSGTTNQVIFGGTNDAPVSAAAPTKWISVQVAGESTVYRLPLYE